MGRGGPRTGAGGEQTDSALDRLLGVPLVPRDGARVVRERGDRARDERELRFDQGRSRGASRPRSDLHGRGAIADRARWMAAHDVSVTRWTAVLRRDLFSTGRSPGPAGLSAAAGGDRRGLSQAAG